jgi:hypothetical protein
MDPETVARHFRALQCFADAYTKHDFLGGVVSVGVGVQVCIWDPSLHITIARTLNHPNRC